MFAVSSRIELLHYLLFETIYKTSNCLHNLPAQAHSVRFAYFQVHIRFVILTAKTIYIYPFSELEFSIVNYASHVTVFKSKKDDNGNYYDNTIHTSNRRNILQNIVKCCPNLHDFNYRRWTCLQMCVSDWCIIYFLCV